MKFQSEAMFSQRLRGVQTSKSDLEQPITPFVGCLHHHVSHNITKNQNITKMQFKEGDASQSVGEITPNPPLRMGAR